MEGPESLAWLGEQPEAEYTVLMGPTTYRVMSGYAAEGEPGTDAFGGLSSIVFSTTLSEPLFWPNTQLVARDAAETGDELMSPSFGLLDMTAYGRLEQWEDSPEGWPQFPTHSVLRTDEHGAPMGPTNGGRPVPQWTRPGVTGVGVQTG